MPHSTMACTCGPNLGALDAGRAFARQIPVPVKLCQGFRFFRPLIEPDARITHPALGQGSDDLATTTNR